VQKTIERLNQKPYLRRTFGTDPNLIFIGGR
jgi:hypothetical protein